MHCTAAIVAGGPARRLDGRDKSHLLVGGRSILDRQLAALRPVTDRILIVANDPDRFAAAGLPVARDLLPGAGALGGIHTALSTATTEHVLVVACDMPFLTEPFLRHLAEHAEDVDLVVPRSADGYEPMCARYRRSCLGRIRRRIEARALRVQDLVADVRTHEIGVDELLAFDAEGHLFFNINTPDDYERAQQLAGEWGQAQEPRDDRIMQRGPAAATKPRIPR